MKAAVIHAPGKIGFDTVDDPALKDSRDAILRVTATAICGSDLHIFSGGIPQPRPMVLGHEFMGIVEETGSGVTNLKKGDRVVVPFPIACGHCFFCNHELPGHCENSNSYHRHCHWRCGGLVLWLQPFRDGHPHHSRRRR